MTSAIEFKQASKTYSLAGGNITALHPLSLSIAQGECFGLLGPNGAGKTTAIGLLAGISQFTQGDIHVLGVSVKKSPQETKKMLGVVPQELVADSFFTLSTMLHLQSLLSGVRPDKAWIDYLLESLLLSEHRKKTTRDLSGGMKRRMMIARALVHKPRVLVLDEPTAGIDTHLRHNMWKFIKELNVFGITIILTTHYLEEAEHFCHRIGILKQGKLISLKSNAEMLLLGEKPRLVFVVQNISENLRKKIEQDLVLRVEQLEENSPYAKEGNFLLSAPYEARGTQGIAIALQKLQEFCSQNALSVGQVFTKSSSLEDVFLKLTS